MLPAVSVIKVASLISDVCNDYHKKGKEASPLPLLTMLPDNGVIKVRSL